jgi:hypothetical protein
MIFLFNDVLLEVGDPRERLTVSGCPIPFARLGSVTQSQIMGLVRSTVFEAPSFARDNADKAAALAALVILKTQANALLCMRTPRVTVAAEMPLRLAQVSLTVLGDLMRRHKDGSLTPTIIDRAVWAAV